MVNPYDGAEPERLRPHSPTSGADRANYALDLAAHEQRRLAAVLAATPDLDPGAVLESEAMAHRMLYGDLDADQLATYRMLVEAGVLDGAEGGVPGA